MDKKSNYIKGNSANVSKTEIIQQNIYCLVEEYVKTDGTSANHIIAVSTEKTLLRELLKAKVTADEFGLVAKNAVQYYDEEYFCTDLGDLDDSYLCYKIFEQKILTREELLEQINAEKQKASTTFEQTIWTYPETKEVCNFMRACRDGDLNRRDMILFITACKKQARLTKYDIQFIQNNQACQIAIYDALWQFLDENNSVMDWNNVRSFYSDERRKTLAYVLGNAYREYRIKNQEE